MHNAWESFAKEYITPQDKDIYYMKPGVSACWKTVHKKMHIPHVIKVFDWNIIEDAKDEIKIAKTIKEIIHKNLVSILKVGQKEELGVYYIMEYWGEDLRGFLKSPPRYEWVLVVMIQLLKAIAELHKHKLVHRDIKPENIFIKNNHIKLGDYGLVKSHRYITELITIAGTHGYMAPEISEEKPYDEKCDIYSAGVVLFELLRQHRNISDQELDEIPYDLGEIIKIAVSKDPAKRFKSASEFIEALASTTQDSDHLDMGLDGHPYIATERGIAIDNIEDIIKD